MPLYCLSNNSPTKEKDTPMPATPSNGQVEPQPRFGLRFRPHDGSEKAQERELIRLSDAPPKTQLHHHDFSTVSRPRHDERLIDDIIAAFNEVAKTMTHDLAVILKRAVLETWKDSSTRGPVRKAKMVTKWPYQMLTGTYWYRKLLYYPHWFFMAAWLGPGHPYLQSIRKDMSDLWGVEFPTDAIIYPKFVPIETQMSLFYGKPAKPTTPKEVSVEERAKAIKKTIDDSTINGLSAAIKEHIPDDLNGFGDSTRMRALETNLASTNRDLEEARKKVNNLEKELAESKTLQANMNGELERTKNDMGALRQEIQLLKTAQTDIVKKEHEALWATLAQHSTSCEKRAAGIEAKVLKGEKDTNTLRNEVAHSAEKAEKALETGALVLSVMSTSGGQKRKRDESS
ncbi:hypothetical protein FPRO06_07889 [Fusarium proliferatum]|nr:hypothetical protein FPRO06_07889 [Fusarium proliferatum]CVL11873.1 uncharacterized protein FPRN_08700 [Fusarium proliferatum]